MRRSIGFTLPFAVMYQARMVCLATVPSSFHARVIAARVGAEGIVTELRGNIDGLYPAAGDVSVFVHEDELPMARELLLADEVEAAFDEPDSESRPGLVVRWLAWATLVALATVVLARML